MLQNELSIAKCGMDTAESGPRKGFKNGAISQAPMVIQRRPKGHVTDFFFHFVLFSFS